ncbi:L-lactate permease, partial [bacterium]|nr:L-lactate permease [bacterium]
MNALSVAMALLPVAVIFVLLAWRKSAADTAGVWGWLAALAVAWLFFGTPGNVLLGASAAGAAASLPITLMVATSILQVTVMLETGAIARVVALVKTVAPQDRAVQVMVLNVGIGTLLAAMGATPVSILPPIMMALGYSSFVSIALPALGYDALCTYALLGIPVVVFSGFVGLPVAQVGGLFARYMPVISTCIALGMLWIAGGWRMVRSGLLPALLSGATAGLVAVAMNAAGMVTLTGVAAGLAVVVVMLLYLLAARKPLHDRAALDGKDIAAEQRMPLAAALSPWIILVIAAVLVNAPALPLFDLGFRKWEMPGAIIPGAPAKGRLLWLGLF